MAVITISREFWSGGDEIAEQVRKRLAYRGVDPRLMAQVAREEGIAEAAVADFSEDHYQRRGFLDALLDRSAAVVENLVVTTTPDGEETYDTQVVNEEMAAEHVAATIRALRARGNVVVVGRGSQAILRDRPDVLHVRVVASVRDRARELAQSAGLTEEGALHLIAERDQAAAEYARRFYGVDWADPTLYHLTINTSLVRSPAEAAELIAAAARQVDERAARTLPPEARSAPAAGRTA
jgi:cytidylate kinase